MYAGGCHASSQCPSTFNARSKKHTFLSRVVVQAALETGLNVRVEPATYELLLGEFSRADCRRIFPKAASKLYMEKFQAVLNALETVSSPACTISAEEKAAYVQTRIDALPLLKAHELKGLRIDAAFENPATGETKWTDVSVMHTSAASYVNAEMKSVGEKINASNIAATFQVPDTLPQSQTQSISAQARSRKKLQILQAYHCSTEADERKETPPMSNLQLLHRIGLWRLIPCCYRTPRMTCHCLCQEMRARRRKTRWV